ncbi:unnamed protein product, partial [Mycena citricolor]
QYLDDTVRISSASIPPRSVARSPEPLLFEAGDKVRVLAGSRHGTRSCREVPSSGLENRGSCITPVRSLGSSHSETPSMSTDVAILGRNLTAGARSPVKSVMSATELPAVSDDGQSVRDFRVTGVPIEIHSACPRVKPHCLLSR